MRQVYSREFKDAIVGKIVNRGEKTIREVCERENVGVSAAANWLRGANMAPMMKKSESRKWTSKEVDRSLPAKDQPTGLPALYA